MNIIGPLDPLDAQPTSSPLAESNIPVELSILMPCLNEAETIGACIREALDFLKEHQVQGEVLVADNGSTDGSQEIARQSGARVVPVKEKGYGAALLGGIKAARGRYIIMGDADGSYDLRHLEKFLQELRLGADVVIGNRFRGGIAPGAMPFLHKYLGNPVLSFLGRLFFSIPLGDFHCGLRAFRADVIRDLQLQTTGMEFASEMIVRSALAGLKIKEVPTTLVPDGRSRPPHLHTWRDGWRHLKFLLLNSPRWLFIIPGVSMIGLGSVLAAALFHGPVQLTAGIQLDINTFIFACFLLAAGVQILTFGALSKYYATVTGFLPVTPRGVSLKKHISTDRLALLAAGFLAVGVSLFGYAVGAWVSRDFGDLVNPIIPRAVIAGLTFQLIAVQMFFSAFLFGVLEIPLKGRG